MARTHTPSLRSAVRAEWLHVRKTRILIVSLIAILFIPIMYGGFFLGSIWDPYGNTSHLPVAVVNKDTGAELNGTPIQLGNDIVAQLKATPAMGWEFVSEEEANSGLDSGHFYMKIEIPAQASANVASITSSTPEKTTIAYTTTPSRNFVASLLTKQAAETIAQTVSNNVTTAYVTSILAQTKQLQSGLSDAASGAADLQAGSQQLSQGILTYTDGAAQLQTGVQKLVAGLPATADISQLDAGVKSIQNGLTSLQVAVTHPDPALTAQQTLVTEDAESLQAALVHYQAIATTAQASIGALSAALSGGTPTVTVNSSDIAATLNLITASQAVAQQAGALLTQLQTLTTMLQAQQTTLATSVGSLSTGMNTLTPGLLSAVDGYSAIRAGGTQLLNGSTTLTHNSPLLISGTTQVAQGTAGLATALNDASQQLAVQPTGDATAQHIASPVAATELQISHVPNYGYALSPYVLSLGLFVGALVFNVIYPVRRFYEKPKNARSWWYAKMSIAFAVAIGQALVLDAIMVIGLGLHPDNLAKFILLSMMTSVTYMSIVSFLAIAFDNIGRFIAMLLLVLQLGAAGGVFPILLSNGFFQALNPLMPMTYSIYAYRQAISSGLGASTYWTNFLALVLISIAFNLLLILFLRLHGMRHFVHETIEA